MEDRGLKASGAGASTGYRRSRHRKRKLSNRKMSSGLRMLGAKQVVLELTQGIA